jgi:integrase
MARKTLPLTNTQIKQVKPTDKLCKLSDGDGLQLWVKPNGSKLWVLDYTHPISKKRSSLSFGAYPALSLADARKKRAEAKELIVNRIDPKEHRDDAIKLQETTSLNTFLSVAEVWFGIKKTKIAETTAISLWRSLENHVFPSLGHRPIDKILAPEAIKSLKPLSAKGSLETTSKLIGYLNEIMNFAVNTGLLHHNSLSGIKAAFETPKAQNMLSLRPEELPELMRALSYASIKTTTRCLIEWQLHTMVRPSEASGATWTEIDLNAKLWTIPAERMKKKRQHVVPLTDQALAILELMKPISGHREHIFPGDRKPSEPSNSQTANKALARMGFKGRLVAHGMRSIASTTLNEQGYDGDVIEAALAHIDKNEVRRAYNRADYIKRRTTMMEWWSAYIENASNRNVSIAATIKGLKLVNFK